MIPGWRDTIMKAYGKITTYEFAEQIAKNSKLGFCSNIDNTTDKRWIYIANDTASNSLTREVSLGGNKDQLLDWWIDYWNYVNLVDVSERYNSTDHRRS